MWFQAGAAPQPSAAKTPRSAASARSGGTAVPLRRRRAFETHGAFETPLPTHGGLSKQSAGAKPQPGITSTVFGTSRSRSAKETRLTTNRRSRRGRLTDTIDAGRSQLPNRKNKISRGNHSCRTPKTKSRAPSTRTRRRRISESLAHSAPRSWAGYRSLPKRVVRPSIELTSRESERGMPTRAHFLRRARRFGFATLAAFFAAGLRADLERFLAMFDPFPFDGA